MLAHVYTHFETGTEVFRMDSFQPGYALLLGALLTALALYRFRRPQREPAGRGGPFRPSPAPSARFSDVAAKRRGHGKPARRAAFYSFARNLYSLRGAGAARCDALRRARHGQDAHGPRPGGRSGGAVFRGQRRGLCGDVRGRGRQPRARAVSGRAQGRTRGRIL